MEEIYFGDPEIFAIRYIPILSTVGAHPFAYCHLVLGGQLIGDPNETCFLRSWKLSVERIKTQLKSNFKSIEHREFAGKRDDEIFELIWKANQSESEFNPNYAYLAVLDNSVWANCHLSIDETTDAFLITMTEFEGNIKFIWQGWREPCPANRIDNLFSIAIDRKLVISTIENCLAKLAEDYSL